MRLNFIVLTIALFSLPTFAANFGKSKEFSVMTYNLENLFDNVHDKGKSDWTWLPLEYKQRSPEVQENCNLMTNEYYRKNCLELDWSDEVIENKIKNLAKVITSYNNGKGADVVVFEEIENMNIMRELVAVGLKKNGYKYFALIEGPDSRGIDIGMISRYPITSKKYHTVSLEPHSSRTTRGILQVDLEVNGKSVTIFGNHWPSQGNSDETRLNASEVLREAADKTKADVIIATGDFNTLHDDMPHGLNQNIYPVFEDIEEKARKVARVKAPGTHWYRGEWESLDKIFIYKKSLKNTRILYNKYEILYHDFMVKDLEWTDFDTGAVYFDKDIPNRFNAKTGEGFSDHLPVAATIAL